MHVAAWLCRGPAKGKEITLTSVKERDVIILHGSQVHVLPEVRLLWGVGRQKTLPVEPFLWATETQRGRVDATCRGTSEAVWSERLSPAATRRSNQRAVLSKWFVISGSAPPSRSSSTKRSWVKKWKLRLKKKKKEPQITCYSAEFPLSRQLHRRRKYAH